MPNPLNLSDAPDLTDKGIQRVRLKNMPHKGEYTKPQKKFLEKKKAKPDTKKAHKILTSDGYMIKRK